MSATTSNVRLFLLNGRETTVTEKKIMHATSRPVTGIADRENCRQNLQQSNEKRASIAESIELTELYELLCEEQRPYTLKELAGFLFEPDDFDAEAALLRKLCADKLYFKNKNDTYQPVSSDELATAREQLARRQAQEEEEHKLAEALKQLEKTGQVDDILKNYLDDLKSLVACGEEARIAKRLETVLNNTELNNQRRLFAALVKAQIFETDENLAVIRYRLPVEFSPEVLAEAENIANTTPDLSRRLDLTTQKTWAIDTSDTRDRDDAFSFEQHADGSCTLQIHVADPAELIEPDSLLDKEAAKRGTSLYMPDQRINMLPAIISEQLFSLDQGGNRLALTFCLKFSPDCELISTEINETLINVDQAIDYDTANSLLEHDNWLQQAFDFSERLQKKREEMGAVIFPRQPELSVKVKEREIIVEHRNRDDLTQGMIAEFMVWANHAAAEFCRKNSLPCLYRVQDGDDNRPKFSDIFDPVQFFAAIKTFRKTTVSQNASRHYSLGLSSYTQATSPLRRYSDLLVHRQLKAAINGKPAQYDDQTLAQTVLISDSAVNRAEEIMRDRDRYFLHKYLKNQQKSGEVVFDGTVVEVGGSEVVFYVDFLCSFKHCRYPSFDVSVGQKVLVKVTQIDLFDGNIKFNLRQP
jgi:exoribonuclease-2